MGNYKIVFHFSREKPGELNKYLFLIIYKNEKYKSLINDTFQLFTSISNIELLQTKIYVLYFMYDLCVPKDS